MLVEHENTTKMNLICRWYFQTEPNMIDNHWCLKGIKMVFIRKRFEFSCPRIWFQTFICWSTDCFCNFEIFVNWRNQKNWAKCRERKNDIKTAVNYYWPLQWPGWKWTLELFWTSNWTFLLSHYLTQMHSLLKNLSMFQDVIEL